MPGEILAGASCPKCGCPLLAGNGRVWCTLVPGRDPESRGCDYGITEPVMERDYWRWEVGKARKEAIEATANLIEASAEMRDLRAEIESIEARASIAEKNLAIAQEAITTYGGFESVEDTAARASDRLMMSWIVKYKPTLTPLWYPHQAELPYWEMRVPHPLSDAHVLAFKDKSLQGAIMKGMQAMWDIENPTESKEPEASNG